MLRFRVRLATLLTVFAFAPAAVAQGEMIENPVYKSWSRFKQGTAVTYKSVTETASNKTEVTLTYTLRALTPDKAVIEMVVATRSGGVEVNNPPQRLENAKLFPLPPGKKKEEFTKPQGVLEAGEEIVKVGDKEYKTRWYKTRNRVEAGDTFSQTWSCDDVPGGLIRSINKTPATGSTTTLELIAVRTP
jgi:hypothetical protein